MKDATWYLTRSILQHATAYEWKRNSNSIVTALATGGGGGVALSIFDSRYRHQDGELIHSHYCDFQSRIVAGVMRQQRYEPAVENEPGAISMGRMEFDVEYRPLPGSTKVWLREQPEEHYGAGEEYVITAPEMHRTWPDDGTVTLRINRYKSRRAGVVVCLRPGEENRLPAEGQAATEIKVAPDQVTPMMLRDIVANALQMWF